jgi:hypothetical protein
MSSEKKSLVPVGRLMAAAGAMLMALVFSATSVLAVVWAAATLIGLPEIILWALLAIGAIPIIWATLWTAGRAWHVEQLLEEGQDVDAPEFRLGEYLPLPFLSRRTRTRLRFH